MSLRQRAGLWIARKALGETVSLTDQDGTQKLVSMLSGGTTHAGVSVTEDSALRISTVWTCVRLLAETIGAMPKAFYERDGSGNMVKISDYELSETLLGSPNRNMTPQELFEGQMVRLGLVGNAYAHITRAANGRVISIDPDDAIVPRLERGVLAYKVGRETLNPADVWHIKGFGNGLVGLSPIGHARQAFGASLAMEQFGASFFRNGATTAGVLTSKEWLTATQRQRAKEILEEMWTGLMNAHKVQLLEGGMEYDPVTMPLEDAQFLESRKFSVSEVCRFYRVPPHMAGDLDRATFSNIEQQGLDFLQYTLLPYFTRYEQTVSRALIRPADRGRVVMKFNPEGLLRADSAARAGLYSVLLQNGVYTRNEVRALENRPRSDNAGMDDFTVQLNMQTTGGENAGS